jgi:putative flippase GtrA
MTRQFLLFVSVGLLQYGIDVLLFAFLFFLGLPVGPANILARGGAAVVGFKVNGALTFHDQRGKQGWGLVHGLRFLALWLGMTAASTALVLISEYLVDDRGLAGEWILGAKLLIEALLALVSFAMSKWWVYTD